MPGRSDLTRFIPIESNAFPFCLIRFTRTRNSKAVADETNIRPMGVRCLRVSLNAVETVAQANTEPRA